MGTQLSTDAHNFDPKTVARSQEFGTPVNFVAAVPPATRLLRLFKQLSVASLAIAAALGSPTVPTAQAHNANPALKIVKDDLLEDGNFYLVKGVIHNPNNRAVKNVVVKYYIWKKWMGQDGHGLVIRNTGGLVQSTIKYIPPKQSVDFTASGGDNAPVMSVESGKVPDPLSAEITAEWGN